MKEIRSVQDMLGSDDPRTYLQGLLCLAANPEMHLLGYGSYPGGVLEKIAAQFDDDMSMEDLKLKIKQAMEGL